MIDWPSVLQVAGALALVWLLSVLLIPAPPGGTPCVVCHQRHAWTHHLVQVVANVRRSRHG